MDLEVGEEGERMRMRTRKKFTRRGGVGEKREMLINLSLTVADCSLTGDRRATDILAEGRKVDCGTCCNDARANRNDRNLSSHSNWTSFGMIHRIDNQLG